MRTSSTEAYPIPRLRWPMTWAGNLVHWTTKGLCWLFFKVVFRCRVGGRQRVPRTGGGILIANHTSYLDPPLIGASTPRLLSYFVKRELMARWLTRWWFESCRCIPVERGSRASLAALREAVARIRAGELVLFFPEGTRSADGTLQEAKPGLGLLIYESRAPVIPCCITGTFAALPRGATWFKPAKVRICFGMPVALDVTRPEGRSMRDHLRQLSNQAMEQIRHVAMRGELCTDASD